MFVRLPQGKFFLATIDMVAPVTNTPRYSRPPSRIRTQKTRSWAPPEHPCQNAARQVTSNPLFRNLRAILMKRLVFFTVAVITTFVLPLGPLFSLGLRL